MSNDFLWEVVQRAVVVIIGVAAFSGRSDTLVRFGFDGSRE